MKPTTLEDLASKWVQDSIDDELSKCPSFTRQDTLVTCVKELREFSAWRPATENPPNNSDLLIARGSLVQRGRFEAGRFLEWRDGDWCYAKCDYWQPLPSPPKGVA